MTTIIAIQDGNEVTLAFDSLATGGDKIQMLQPKVFVRNGVIFGVAGTALLSNELRYADIPEPTSAPEDTDRWLTRELMPVIRGVVERLMERSDGEYELHILVVVNGKAYEIGGNLGWVQNTEGVYAAGSGTPFALGAIAVGANATKALEAAAKCDPYTGGTLTTTTASELLKEG